jgi:glycosyltransferase involved in cell wall biosynthesis
VPERRTIVLAANSDWNIANFRGGLIRALKAAGYEPVIVAPQEPAAERRMRALEVARIPIAIQRSGLNPAADMLLLRSLRRLLKRLRPAAYLSYTIKPNIYGAIAAGSLGIPAFPNVSGLGTAFLRGRALQRFVTMLYRIGFRRAPVVFFQNSEDRDVFVGRRIVRAEQARVLPGSGVDLAHFAPGPPPQGPPTFLLVGRMLRDKGVLEFVEAARLLRSVLPDARFQLLGPIDEGNRTAVGHAEIDAWVREGLVEYLGSAEDVRPFIAASTAVVLPSYREGLPRSLLEAAAMERPLIATDVPGCRDVVENGVNGYLCSVRDSTSLADAMRRLAILPAEQRLAMAQAARRKVQERFSEELVVAAYLDALSCIAAEAGT